MKNIFKLRVRDPLKTLDQIATVIVFGALAIIMLFFMCVPAIFAGVLVEGAISFYFKTEFTGFTTFMFFTFGGPLTIYFLIRKP